MCQTTPRASRYGRLLAVSTLVLLVGGCPLTPCMFCGDLLKEALCRARQAEPAAIVFQISGVNGLNATTGEYETQSYTFFAADPGDGDVTYELAYDLTGWTTTTSAGPLLGVGYYDVRDVTMTEGEARELLVAAGYGENFLGWSLYQPLFPGAEGALYIFNYGDYGATVNTLTGQVSGLVVPVAPPLGAAPGDDSVSLQMIAAADTRIKEQARSAFIIWAGGRDGSGEPLNAAGDTNVWDFVAIALNGSEVPAWRLTYDGTWQITELPMPPYGIQFLDLNGGLALDAVEAWELAVNAGYTPPFSSWEVFKPLNPTVVNPIYVFPSSAGFVIVDAITGEVSLETE